VFVHLIHLLPTKKYITDHCSSVVQFWSFSAMPTASWQLSH
jgi:hypothetical protein